MKEKSNLKELRSQRNYWMFMFLLVIIGLASIAFYQLGVIYPNIMTQMCHAYGYDALDSYSVQQSSWNFELASLKCVNFNGNNKIVFKVI